MWAELHLYGPGVLLAYGACLLGLMSPGPNILAVIGASMGAGRRAGSAMALGVASGSAAWALLAVSGLTALLALYAHAMFAIKILGALYLLWLAVKAFRSAAAARPLNAALIEGRPGFWPWWRRGFLIQMTNPKAALTWIAIAALALDASAPAWVALAVVAGTAALSASAHLAYACAFSTAPMVAAYARARRWIEAGLGAFFCFASYKLLTAKT